MKYTVRTEKYEWGRRGPQRVIRSTILRTNWHGQRNCAGEVGGSQKNSGGGVGPTKAKKSCQRLQMTIKTIEGKNSEKPRPWGVSGSGADTKRLDAKLKK